MERNASVHRTESHVGFGSSLTAKA